MPNFQKLPSYPIVSTTRGATCSLCNVPQRTNHEHQGEPVYDTGLDIVMEGTIVICHQCVLELGHLAGMIEETAAKARKSDVNRLEYRQRKVRAAGEKVEAAQAALAELAEALT